MAFRPHFAPGPGA